MKPQMALLAFAGIALAADDRPIRALAGRVVDERHFPIVGAIVQVRDSGSGESTVATTAADGWFEADISFARATRVGDLTFDLSVDAGASGIGLRSELFRPWPSGLGPLLRLRAPIVVAAGGGLAVAVRDEEGAVAGAMVDLRFRTGLARAVTDGSGRVLFDRVPADELELFASREGRGRRTIDATVERGATTEVVVELRPLRPVEVEVVDADSGDPVSDAAFEVWRAPLDPEGKATSGWLRDFDCAPSPPVTGADGRTELRLIETGFALRLDATAPGYSNYWSRYPDECIPGEHASRTEVDVAPGATSVRLELKRHLRRTLRWRIEESEVAAPPDGTKLALRFLQSDSNRREAAGSHRATIQDGAIVAEIDLPFTPGPVPTSHAGWADAPDGSIAELQPHGRRRPIAGAGGETDLDAPGEARFRRGASLEVVLVDSDGSPRKREPVSVLHESRRDHLDAAWNQSAHTDESGVAVFPALIADRWVVHSDGAWRVVDLRDGDVRCTLAPTQSAEIVFQFTVNGERRLPREFSLSLPGEHRFRQREDPGRGDVHAFLTRPAAGQESTAHISITGIGSMLRPLPPFPESGALVVPVSFDGPFRGEAVARVRNAEQASRTRLIAERFDEGTGRFVEPEVQVFMHQLGSFRHADGARLTGMPTGVWRLAIPETGTFGEPAIVSEDGPPAELTIDASTVRTLPIAWKVPAGESDRFLELDVPRRRGLVELAWFGWTRGWPLAPEDARTRELSLDLLHPPKLLTIHPYLVSSRWNDAIDLTKPRSALTLHMDVGPLVTLVPELPEDAPPVLGAFVTLASITDPAVAPERLRMLRRGETFAMAPPPAGERSVLIDPIVAAPVELARVAFDGEPADLGTIGFPRGSTLRVRPRVSAPFVAPRVVAHAVRIDGIRYERASPPAEEGDPPAVLEIRGLGPGRFRVLLHSVGPAGSRTWASETMVDGVSDSEITIDVD